MQRPLKWHGGKHYLAKWIVSLMPPHLHYVEPYFGGGAVLFARNPNRDWMQENGEKLPAHLKGCSEVVNDIDRELMNFWSILRDQEQFIQLSTWLNTTPFSKPLFEAVKDAVATLDGCGPKSLIANDVARAVWFFIIYRQSRQGLGKDFATLTRNRTRGGRNEQANSWLSAIEGLPEIHERLKGVVILNDDAIKVIEQQDGEHTLFYCDPPYLHETRNSTGEYGEHEMTVEQHIVLLETLSNITGKFMLSGYHSYLYDDWATYHGLNCHEKQIDNKASSKKLKDKEVECVWTNF